MINEPVLFSDSIKNKVDAYNNQKTEDKLGKYWDNEKDKELIKVKKHIKDYYIIKQNHICPYCQQQTLINHNAVWDTEHIIPKDKYPQFLFEPENLCIACKECNQAKSNTNVLKNPNRKTFPNKSEDYNFIHPHFDDYSSSIKILKSSLFFIPRNDKGKKTIETCGLLRFLYKYSNYSNIPLEIKNKIGHLHTELMNTNNSIEEHFILSRLEELVDHGKKIAQEQLLTSKS